MNTDKKMEEGRVWLATLAGFCAIILNGCATNQVRIENVSETEAAKYESAYLSEYEKIKQANKDFKPLTKWMQPKNKKTECKVYFGVDPNNDITTRPDYEFYWDGDCKDGYAYGLGREIEITMFENRQQIGFYKDGKAIDYCVQIDKNSGVTREGECNYDYKKSDHYVKTIVDEKNGDINVAYEFGKTATPESPWLMMKNFPLHQVVEYYKVYPNFSYVITNLSRKEFDNRNTEFNIRDHKTGKSNGFGFAVSKSGERFSGEAINGSIVRRVNLPQSYFNNIEAIYGEINGTTNAALDAQKKALMVKEKYKSQICKSSVKVEFMDNDLYKEVCNEEQRFTKIKEKIDAKLAQISNADKLKREQINQQKLVNAREMEAAAAQRRASAAEDANFQRSLDSFNQNMQMQQLNNNLMMYNLMPKNYNIFVR